MCTERSIPFIISFSVGLITNGLLQKKAVAPAKPRPRAAEDKEAAGMLGDVEDDVSLCMHMWREIG